MKKKSPYRKAVRAPKTGPGSPRSEAAKARWSGRAKKKAMLSMLRAGRKVRTTP